MRVMTEKQLSVFRRLFIEFRRRYNHAPNLVEWEDFIVEQEIFGSTNETVIRRLAARVYESFSSVEVMSSEIETKVRDAKSNLNNRKYNFGNF